MVMSSPRCLENTVSDTDHLRPERSRRFRWLPIVLACLVLVTFLTFPLSSARAARSAYPLKELPLLRLVLRYLQKRYVDPTQFSPEKMVRGALKRLEKNFSDVWIEGGSKAKTLKLHYKDKVKVIKLGTFLGLLDVWIKLQPVAIWMGKHYKGSRSILEIEYALVSGVMKTLDKQTGITSLFSILRRRLLSRRRSVGKIGVTISYKNQKLLITRVLSSGPAALAGLKAGDRIVRVEGKVVKGKTIFYWIGKVTGLRGSRVRLGVLRKGWKKPRDFLLRRSRIATPLVIGHLLPGKVGYIRLRQFARGASLLIRAELARLRSKSGGNLLGLVLDLRSNPGGLVTEAVKICSLFVEEGLVVTYAGANVRRRSHYVSKKNKEERYPLVVLLNGRSASASELLSSALQQHNRALLVGQQSYGKGTVQVSGRLRKDVFFRVTIAQYLGPNDVSVQGKGVTPDVELFPVVLRKNDLRYFGWQLSDLALRKKRWPKFLQQNLLDKRKVWASIPYLVMPFKSTPVKGKKRQRTRLRPRAWMKKNKPGFLDLQVWFARYLISNSTQGRRDLFFRQIQPQIRKFMRIQQKRIAKQLKTLGIDWKAPGRLQGDAPKLQVELQWEKVKGRILEAGKSYRLRIRVRNPGKKPAYRVRGMLFSRILSLRHKEWLFGRVNPGKTVERVRKLVLSPRLIRRVERLRLEIRSELRKTPLKVFNTIEIKPKRRPRYAIQWHFHDPAPDGNDDGQMQPGERGILRVIVENQSSVKSPALQLRMNLTREIKLLRHSRLLKLGAMNPGQRRFLELPISVSSKTKPGKKTLKLLLLDRKAGSFLFYSARAMIAKGRVVMTEKPSKALATFKKTVEWKARGSNQGRALLRFAAGSSFRVLRQSSTHVQLALPTVLFGSSFQTKTKKTAPWRLWLPRSQVTLGDGNPKGTPALRFDYVAPQARLLSPQKRLSNSSSVEVKLSLKAVGGLISAFVLHGKQKIYYKYLESTGKAPVSAILRFPVRLKKGVNSLYLSARTKRGRLVHRFYLSYYP